jgi:hypothetical protein
MSDMGHELPRQLRRSMSAHTRKEDLPASLDGLPRRWNG